jgi:hypothetical protein
MEFHNKIAKIIKDKSQQNKIVQDFIIAQVVVEQLLIRTVLKLKTSNVGKLMTMGHYLEKKQCKQK